MTTIKRWLCKHWHTAVRFGGGATYSCPRCGCVFPTPWAAKDSTEEKGRWLKGEPGEV